MIKVIFLSFAILCVVPVVGLSQATFTSKIWAFSMQEPKAWLSMGKAERSENIDKLDMSDQALALMNKSNTGFVFVTGYQKYDPKEREGLIPGIQVQARKIAPMTFTVFKQQIANSWAGMDKIFQDFKLIAYSEVMVSGYKGVKSIFTFTVPTKDGQILKARSTVYAIPRSNYFFQINFNDGADKENDCTAEFDALVKTISITR